MRLTIPGLAFLIATGLAACTSSVSPSESPPAAAAPTAATAPATATTVSALITDEGATLYLARAVTPPTPAMLQAALANSPDAMRDAVATQTTCQAAVTCPPQYASCSTWSTYTLCGSQCGPGVCICKPVIDCSPDDPSSLRGRDTYNAFRVCFDSNQNACTEWAQSISTYCGC
jgi:hypothetical protein